jgi:hypothetical protein
MTTDNGAGDGVDYPIVRTFTEGLTYRLRAGVRVVSGTSFILRLGGVSDAASSTPTVADGWAWYTVDWTPSATVGTAWVSIQDSGGNQDQ